MIKKIMFFILLGSVMNSAFAYKINDVEVIRYGERYLITFNAYLDAPIERVQEVMYNFENADKLTPAVKSTEVYRFDDTTARVSTILRPCVFLFCKTMEKLTIVNLEENKIHLLGVQDAGSFRNTDEVIKYYDENQGTSVRYKGDLSPRFYLPRWLGVHFIKGTVRKYLGGMLANIENQANDGA